MNTPPRLFDIDLLARRRARVQAGAPADFLHREAAGEISERLREVNRSFRAPALVTGWPDPWREALADAGLEQVRVVHDTEVLGLAEGAHDLVIHGLALHWANDPVGQLVQARRALQPDGLFLGAMLGGLTLHELRAAFAEAEAEITGGLSPRVAPMGEIRDLGGLLQRAGFALPVADTLPLTVDYGSPLDLMRDLRAMGETNVLADRCRQPLRRDLLARACAIYAANYGRADGRIDATFETVVLTGWAPGPGQQQPLRPGSAKARLADALGVPERGAGEKAGGG